MKKEFFGEVSEVTDDNGKIKLTYYLITDSVREEYCDLKVYGAEISSEYTREEGFCEKESRLIKNLFFRRSEAVNFLEKLKRNSVTPIGLKEAVHEHIGEQIRLITCKG